MSLLPTRLFIEAELEAQRKEIISGTSEKGQILKAGTVKNITSSMVYC